MHIFILLFSVIIFFFCLFIFSREDYLLIRKNISVEEMFNLSFLGLLVVLFFARSFFVALHPSLRYLNPLVFFLFPYFPGLSLLGAVLGGIGFVLFITSENKKPTARILDILSLSFLLSLPITFFIQVIIDLFLRKQMLFVMDLVTCILYLISCIFLVQWFVKNKYKDGMIGTLVVITITVVSLAQSFLTMLFAHTFTIQIESILWFVVLLMAILWLIIKRKK